jgi:hypothetical protein
MKKVKVDDSSELEEDISSAVHKRRQEVPTSPCRQPQHRREMSTAQAGENGRLREVEDMSLKLRLLKNLNSNGKQEGLKTSKFDCKSFAMNDF